MITPGLHPLCQLLSIYKFEILHHSILGNSDKRRDFDPTVLYYPIMRSRIIFISKWWLLIGPFARIIQSISVHKNIRVLALFVV